VRKLFKNPNPNPVNIHGKKTPMSQQQTQTSPKLMVQNALPDSSPYGVLAHTLSAWYANHQRNLPWRHTQDPYAIWVSEVMLQQTQVATVLPYYQRFMQQYPTVDHLAQAPLDAVLKQWEGLGYYTRCRNMHKAAVHIMQHLHGQFPSTFEGVQALPGVGRSTAGAIMTFAHQQPYPILDGNVKRVLARVFALSGTNTAYVNQLWAHATLLVQACQSATVAYQLNQGLMELGATHCSRTQPQCLLCPLMALCQAHAHGLTDVLPVKLVRKPVPHYTIAGAVIEKNGLIYVQQRPAEGLLGGLWEFPGGKQEPHESITDAVHREVLEETGMHIGQLQPLVPVDHAYTHFRITLHMFKAQWVAGKPQTEGQPFQWLPLGQLRQLAFPKANVLVLDQLGA
jgi:A/G-specific adenine glycosylase